MKKTTSGLKIVDARLPIAFTVTGSAIRRAKCKDPDHCVIAEALREHFGDAFDSVQVGSNVTKVFLSDRIIRFSTPGAIRRAIPIFDKTGKWPLEKGEAYVLQQFRVPSLDKRKRAAGKNRPSGFQGKHRAVRSRQTERIRVASAA